MREADLEHGSREVGAGASPLTLRVEELSVSYATSRGRVRALDHVSLSIPRGQVLGLVGESGSGKSTVVLALLGLLDAAAEVSAASLEFAGHDLLADPVTPRGRRIGTVFQDPSSILNPALPVGLQVAEPLLVHRRMGRREAFERATELLAKMGIPRPDAVMRAYPHQLSGGMKQRALIAQALATEPDLLLLDEPTTALDVTVEAQILDLLDRLRAERGLTMLLVSHNLGIVDRICDRVCVLYAGRTLESGPTSRLLEAPRHPYTRGLLSALPRPDRSGAVSLVPIPGNLPDLTNPDPGCNFRPRCPFAAEGCADPQSLAEFLPGHSVRCHRAGVVATLPWPAPEPVARAEGGTSSRHGERLVEASGMQRSFQSGGTFARLLGSVSVTRAVDGVSLAIGRGESVGLVGESGCGKSTLGRLLLRLIAAESGALRFAGEVVPEHPAAEFRRRAQIVFQNPDTALNPRQTVAAILSRPLVRFALAEGREVEREVERLLDLVRLPGAYRGRYPHQLSGGEKQRVGIARALATRPDFVIADEAVSALDVSVQAAVLNLLAELRDRLGVAYLFISHDIGVIAHIAERVAVMYRGRLVEEGATAQVLHPPYHPYTEALLSAVPLVGARERSAARIRLAGDASSAIAGAGCPFAARCPRRIGPICDTVPPPWQVAAKGHRIACHIPLAALAEMPPALGG
ncbi:MAG: dipeptide ABC transporter ATP-binding protein [Acetobacteraceae bacterium]